MEVSLKPLLSDTCTYVLLQCLYLAQAMSNCTPEGMDSYGFVDKGDTKTCLKIFSLLRNSLQLSLCGT